MKTVKAINWSYPSSGNARRFGFHDAGCWTVSVGEFGQPLKGVAGFAEKPEAIAHAKALPFEWDTILGKKAPEAA